MNERSARVEPESKRARRWFLLASSAAALLVLVVLAALRMLPGLVQHYGPIQGGGGFPQAAPFSDLIWTGQGDELLVRVDQRWYRLETIGFFTTAQLSEFARKTYGPERWRRRIAEDLIEVLTLMGRPEVWDVDLEVEDLESGRRLTLADVRLSAANQRAVGEARRTRRAPWSDARWKGEVLEVEIDGQWWELLGACGHDREQLEARARAESPAEWRQLLARQPLEVLLDAKGHFPSGGYCYFETELLVRLPTTGVEQRLPDVPVDEDKWIALQGAASLPQGTAP